jgi:hypothetical protein
MGAKPRVGRPRKRTVRVELRLNGDDILVARFLGAPIQQQEPEHQQAKDSANALADEWM